MFSLMDSRMHRQTDGQTKKYNFKLKVGILHLIQLVNMTVGKLKRINQNRAFNKKKGPNSLAYRKLLP